jgi:hypothetical protein
MLWVQILITARCTTLCDKVCQWLATGLWFSPGTPVSSTSKTDRHDITEILLKVVLNTINLNLKGSIFILFLAVLHLTVTWHEDHCTIDWVIHTLRTFLLLYRVHLVQVGFELTTLVVIGTDCIGSCNSKYHRIMTTMTPAALHLILILTLMTSN